MFKIKKLFSKIKENIEKEKCYIEGYNYDELQTRKELYFYSTIKEKEMKYFKFIKKDSLINFTDDDYDNIFNCIKVLCENNIKNIKILKFNKSDKKEFDEYLKKNNIDSIFDNVDIQIDYNATSLKNYIRSEKVLNNIIKPALDLSPLEKYIYAYNVTKHFKKYNENENCPRNSRDLYQVLDNEYIVCVGFCQILLDLLDKLNIKSIDLFTSVYDQKSLDGHMRNYVYLKDEKYGIDGFYLTDPTFDNDLIEDKYNFMLFTDRKCDYSIYPEELNEHLLFNSSSIFEFNRNYDILLKRLDKYDRDLLKYIIDVIRIFDPVYFKELRAKHSIINGIYIFTVNDYNHKSVIELKNELGNYIVSKVNKEIDKEKIKSAIRVIYDKFYGFSDKNKMDEYLDDVYKYNEERECIAFPLLEKNKSYVKKL